MGKKIYKKWKGNEVISFVIFTIVLLIVIAFLLESPSELLLGMKKIILSRDVLITDYFQIASYGSTFLNAALVMSIGTFLLWYEKAHFTGFALAALFINGGFALFGKNPINILPIILGTTLYATLHHTKLNRYIYIALFGNCLAPFVTEMVYIMPFSMGINLLCGMFMGIFIGFALPSLSAHTASMHMGYNLFNVGFSAGILAFVIMCVFQAMGITSNVELIWKEGAPTIVVVGMYAYFGITILYGLIINKGKITGLKKIIKHPGRAVADFVLMDGAGTTFMNMGIMGCICVSYIWIIGGDFSGPVMGAILTAFGFAAFGAHPKNYFPVLLGVFLSTFINQYTPITPSVQLASMFVVGVAPIAGQFGFIAGIVAGGLHVAIVTCTPMMYAGLNLYNNGFSCGWVAIIMVPLMESIMRRFADKTKGGSKLAWFMKKRK